MYSQKTHWNGDRFHTQMISESISRGLRGVQKKEKVKEDMNRIYFYRHPQRPLEIKTIQRIYSPYTKAFSTLVDTNFVVMKPLDDWIEINQQQLINLSSRKNEITPYRYGNK